MKGRESKRERNEQRTHGRTKYKDQKQKERI
jgi:hypothetical protein